MTEYTSLEVSKRLAEAGFDGIGGFDNVGYPFKWLERAPGDADLVEGWHGAESGDGPIAYRSDTLLAWLMTRGWDISIGMPHNKILVDAASMKSNMRFAVEGDTLPDALAEVVMKVLEGSK